MLGCCKISLPGPVPRLGGRAFGGVDALPAGGPGYWPFDFIGRQEPVRSQPNYLARLVLTGGDAVGIPVRFTRHAGCGPGYYLRATGALLRCAPANHFFG